MTCRSSCDVADVLAQHFGRPQIPSGDGEKQKSMNGFQYTVYIPTNWRANGVEPLESKLPNLMLRYGGTTAQAPYYYQKNYFGLYPLKQQPTLDIPQPYDLTRYS